MFVLHLYENTLLKVLIDLTLAYFFCRLWHRVGHGSIFPDPIQSNPIHQLMDLIQSNP